MAPRTSIIVALYNSEAYLEATVTSVVNQTDTDWELILVDDASKDGSLALAKRLAKEEPRIQVIGCETNHGGPAHARNVGLAAAKGTYVTILDHDDTFKPRKLERMVEVMQNERIDFLCSNIELVNATTGEVDGLAWGAVTGDVRKGFRKRLLAGNFVPPNSTLIRRSVFDTVAPFDESLKGVDDYDMWYRIVREYPAGIVNEPLATWRYLNSESISANDMKMVLDERVFYEKIATSATEAWEKKLARAGARRAAKRAGNRYVLSGSYGQAARAYISAEKPLLAVAALCLGPVFRFAYAAKRRHGQEFSAMNLSF